MKHNIVPGNPHTLDALKMPMDEKSPFYIFQAFSGIIA
jgi:hypothetical protein